MGFTTAQYIEMQVRLAKNAKKYPPRVSSAIEREMGLHDEIIKWCNSQWPRVKYIRSRSDKASTIQVGAQDFTIFLPNGKTLCVECKSKTNKLSQEQLIWRKEMEMLDHTVHEIRSMEGFLDILNK